MRLQKSPRDASPSPRGPLLPPPGVSPPDLGPRSRRRMRYPGVPGRGEARRVSREGRGAAPAAGHGLEGGGGAPRCGGGGCPGGGSPGGPGGTLLLAQLTERSAPKKMGSSAMRTRLP